MFVDVTFQFFLSVLQVLVICFQIAAFLILENYILEFIGHFVCYLRKQPGNAIALISASTYISGVPPVFRNTKENSSATEKL